MTNIKINNLNKIFIIKITIDKIIKSKINNQNKIITNKIIIIIMIIRYIINNSYKKIQEIKIITFKTIILDKILTIKITIDKRIKMIKSIINNQNKIFIIIMIIRYRINNSYRKIQGIKIINHKIINLNKIS